MAVFEMRTGTGVRVKAISFAGPGSPEQPVTHQGLIVLEWCEERQDSTYEEGAAGEPKFWLAGPDGKEIRVDKKRQVVHEAINSHGGANIPIMMQPVLVWAPGPTGQGMVNPDTPGDFGVRQLILGDGKDLTYAIMKRAKDIGRLTLDPADRKLKGQLWPGDVINAGWHGKVGKTKLYDGPQTQVFLGNEQTQQFAAQAYARHQEWVAQRQAEQAEAEGITTGSQPPAPNMGYTSSVQNTYQQNEQPAAPATAAAPAAPPQFAAPNPPGMTPATPAQPVAAATPAVDPAYQAYQAFLDQQAAAAAAQAAAVPPAPPVAAAPAGPPPGVDPAQWAQYQAFQATQVAAPPADPNRPNFAPPVGVNGAG
jgi:hypothetical protein